ncbi:MAG: xylose isomerase [Actinomycetia bacterium]|nr:xylose isomerase [Actinomycetes bacterium]
MTQVPPVPALPPVLAATGPFFMFSLEETFELIGEAGFDGAELMIMQDRVSQDPLRLGALAARYGVPVPAVHGPFLVATWLVFGTDPKGKLERCVRFAETAKVSTVVIHPPYRWQTQYAAWLDEAIPRIREETGVTIAVENMFPINVNGRSLRFFSGTAPSELGRWPSLVLDTSHLAVAGGDLLAAWDELGFGGAVTLELDVRTWADDRKALLEVLRENLGVARAQLAKGATGARARTASRNG